MTKKKQKANQAVDPPNVVTRRHQSLGESSDTTSTRLTGFDLPPNFVDDPEQFLHKPRKKKAAGNHFPPLDPITGLC